MLNQKRKAASFPRSAWRASGIPRARNRMQLAREWPPGAQCSRRRRVLLLIYLG